MSTNHRWWIAVWGPRASSQLAGRNLRELKKHMKGLRMWISRVHYVVHINKCEG